MAKLDPNELAFDFSTITAREMSHFNRAIQTNDMEGVAQGLTRVVVSCPHGDPSNPDTFLDLPLMGGWRDVMRALNESLKNAAAS